MGHIGLCPYPGNWPVIFLLDCLSGNPTLWRLGIFPPAMVNSVERKENTLPSVSLWRIKYISVHRVERNHWQKVFLKVFTAKSLTKTSLTHWTPHWGGYRLHKHSVSTNWSQVSVKLLSSQWLHAISVCQGSDEGCPDWKAEPWERQQIMAST